MPKSRTRLVRLLRKLSIVERAPARAQIRHTLNKVRLGGVIAGLSFPLLQTAASFLVPTTIRGTNQSKKSALLEVWRKMKVDNPLNTVVRNLAQVAIVLALYMLGDVDMSAKGRAAYLMHPRTRRGGPSARRGRACCACRGSLFSAVPSAPVPNPVIPAAAAAAAAVSDATDRMVDVQAAFAFAAVLGNGKRPRKDNVDDDRNVRARSGAAPSPVPAAAAAAAFAFAAVLDNGKRPRKDNVDDDRNVLARSSAVDIPSPEAPAAPCRPPTDRWKRNINSEARTIIAEGM
ncbi:hypothetical protein B0H14DRAFT_3506207 [Mycena olivaceomarginata]|nr:hypothetical protein B0H14DRAFT_3506207 [Mycena olivaceomarginata]